MQRYFPNLYAFLLLLLTTLVACGPVKLISDYDEVTDKGVIELQKKVANYFVKLDRAIGTDKADYQHFETDFDQMKVDLYSLEIRAQALEKNRIVQEQLALISQMVNDLEQLHKIGFASRAQIEPARQPFTTAFVAITKLQLALKRGEKEKK